MRYSKVTPAGDYIPPPAANSKASFSTMTYVRATIVEDAGEYLARAVTIAVRYQGLQTGSRSEWGALCARPSLGAPHPMAPADALPPSTHVDLSSVAHRRACHLCRFVLGAAGQLATKAQLTCRGREA